MSMEPNLPRLTEPQRRRVAVRAVFKPLNVLTLIAGLGLFITTQLWWILPVTVAIYAVVVYLAARDPLFAKRVLNGPDKTPRTPGASQEIPPERRARWLPRGETREKVESALVTYRKVMTAIEESDDVTKRVLEDSIPKLHVAADRLVDVARNRERAAATLLDFGDDRQTSNGDDEYQQRETSLRQLEAHIQKADEEISALSDQLLTLRAQVVRASMDEAGGPQQASSINSSLDNLNFRLEALNETLSNPDEN